MLFKWFREFKVINNEKLFLKDLHEAGFIHRDIKPENFLVGENDENYLYLIDFGLGKSYLINGLHEPFK